MEDRAFRVACGQDGKLVADYTTCVDYRYFYCGGQFPSTGRFRIDHQNVGLV